MTPLEVTGGAEPEELAALLLVLARRPAPAPGPTWRDRRLAALGTRVSRPLRGDR